MIGSLVAVLVGTFTLRFSTGLTGTLLFYYLANLQNYPGGSEVSPLTAGMIGALYFAAELILSPLFGSLSDRFGAHRIMQPGPVMGAVAVVLTAFTVNVAQIGALRFLEGAAAAASIPAALGYIALATVRDQGLRGRVVARFEAATLAGIGMGVVAAGFLWSAIGPAAFFVNAGIYGISFLIFRYGVSEMADQHPAAADLARRPVWHGYRVLLRNRAIWLLAPTWIALNAVLGSWSTQSIFQLVGTGSEDFPDQVMMGGLEPWQVSVAAGAVLAIFFFGLFYWGNRFRRFRRTTIIGVGVAGGLVFMAALLAFNHSESWPVLLGYAALVVGGVGLFVMAGATPAAVGLLADISEGFPGQRGAVMGLYSVFLAVGQIIGSLVAGLAAEWRGIDGMLVASFALLIIALLPLGQLRAMEHHLPTQEEAPHQPSITPEPLS